MAARIGRFGVVAADLSECRAALRDLPGVTVSCGARHVEMSNRVCPVGNGSVFEPVAVEPETQDPGRARWFTPDDPGTRVCIASQPVDGALAAVRQVSRDFAPGPATRGNVRRDGAFPEFGRRGCPGCGAERPLSARPASCVPSRTRRSVRVT